MANSLLVIEPYRMDGGIWAFDDERAGLLAEPFVREVSAMIDRYVADIPNAEQQLENHAAQRGLDTRCLDRCG